MKRLSLIPLVCLSVALVSCSDTPERAAATTAPGRPRLTVANLPANASTVCVSAVKQRDQLTEALKTLSGETRVQKLAALDALIEDACY
jgi:hypothetical protein